MSRADSPLRGRMIFNVGARRSGTFWLQRIVTAHPQVSAVPSETHLFAEGIAPLFGRFQHSLRSSSKVGQVYVDREQALDAVRDLCDVVFAGMLEPGSTRLAERTPTHVFHLELIAAIYPDARFVHIIRDGRDAARSIAAQDWGPAKLEEAAAEWRDAVVAGRRAALAPEIYHEVRYEDLLRDPAPVVAGLFTWLGLEAGEDVIDEALGEASIGANQGQAPSGIDTEKWRASYSDEELAEFDRIAGSLLRELGYPTARRAAPRPKPAVRESLVHGVRRRMRSIRGPRLRTGDATVHTRPLQELVERVIGALQDGAPEELEPALTGEALVRVVSADGAEQGRGERGRELVRRLLEERSPFAGEQMRGDVYLALPYAGAALAYRTPAGGLVERTVFVRFQGKLIGELIVYAL
jgi:sulfotransferase family protein